MQTAWMVWAARVVAVMARMSDAFRAAEQEVLRLSAAIQAITDRIEAKQADGEVLDAEEVKWLAAVKEAKGD